jgi:hypothetical protein
MNKNAKISIGLAAALGALIAGGLAVALPAQATSATKSTSVVESTDPTDTGSEQNEAPDTMNDGETADDAGVEDGANDGETADDAGVEDPTDDIGEGAVEDGTKN